ncbi:unnamed protein product [Linum trigynum]|uniref:DNA-directed RNA polymerase subunit n=1 Tax=Linum trigynum TaxID=586398 RepID=A0AAV2GDD8_9ROSI
MFFLSLIEHKLRLPPEDLSLPLHKGIKKVLDGIFLDKVISNLGLCVSIYDIRNISGGFIQAGEGAPTYTVEFRMVVFRPFTGEIIVAKIIESDNDGLRLSLGFFDDIYVPAHQLPQPCHQIPDPDRRYKVRWIWEYDIEDTGNPEQYNIDGLDEVKLQVLNVSFPPLPIEQQEKPFAPMLVTGSISECGLGPVSWW